MRLLQGHPTMRFNKHWDLFLASSKGAKKGGFFDGETWRSSNRGFPPCNLLHMEADTIYNDLTSRKESAC